MNLPRRYVRYQVGSWANEAVNGFHAHFQRPGSLLDAVKQDVLERWFNGVQLAFAFGLYQTNREYPPSGIGWPPHPDVPAVLEWCKLRGIDCGFYEGSCKLLTVPKFESELSRKAIQPWWNAQAVEAKGLSADDYGDHIHEYAVHIAQWEPDYVVFDQLPGGPDPKYFIDAVADAFYWYAEGPIRIICEPDTDHHAQEVQDAVAEAGLQMYRICESEKLDAHPHRPALGMIQDASKIGRRMYQLGGTYTGTKDKPVTMEHIERAVLFINHLGHDAVVQRFALNEGVE